MWIPNGNVFRSVDDNIVSVTEFVTVLWGARFVECTYAFLLL